jgi:transcriptional regulator with XRE-family HTH domain
LDFHAKRIQFTNWGGYPVTSTLAEEKQDTTGFGSRLRVLREAAGLTQEELAEKVGMNYQNIGRLERGDRSPSWKTVLKLAEALGVEPNDFTDKDADEPDDDKPATPKRPRKK